MMDFHPLIAHWFAGRFTGPTEPQRRGWPEIAAGRHTLIAAPTGSGKTLTAFLAVIDRLVHEAETSPLPDEIRVVYVSPLRALSNDMQRNLQEPLGEMAALAEELGRPFPTLRVGLRTGDTTAAARAAIIKRPPHILVTTPESLYLLLTSERGRERLRHVEVVIVDEIHALVRDKRGSHLALSLERLAALSERPIQRIGLSATQKPLERVAEFLIGSRSPGVATLGLPCAIINTGHQRQLDLAIEVPVEALGAVCTHEQWAVVHQRICELITSHRSTLIFVNTRRMAERLTHQLSEILGAEHVSSHHGSLSTEMRHKTEQRLKAGDIKAVVATASLELGIDIGYIDLVIQIGSPRAIAAFLQRIGRSGHSLHAIPKGRIVALTRDELVECAALIRAVRHGILDVLRIPVAPLDVLVQQVVAETCFQEWNADRLFELVRQADPFRDLSRDVWEETLRFLSEGFTSTSGRKQSLIYYDRIGKRIKARPASKMIAVGNAGAIPETGSYRVVAEPEHTVIGSVDEDFAVESMRGDIFQLGNTSWRIERVRQGDVVVSDAQGAPPTIPFWFGEGLGRTLELSQEVSRLRNDLAARLDDPAAATDWLVAESSCPEVAAGQLVEYFRTEQTAIGLVPSQQQVVFERFFDESGGMQLVIHAPFGSPITRGWGYALRKRFCRSFDFELQATADDDGVILSLGPQHSFPLESLFGMLTSQNVRSLLEQAILVQPPFQLRWRWNVTRALFVARMKFGKKVPPALQRFRSEDLLTGCFPQLTGCLENHTGDIEIPNHPLVQQTMYDCLHEAVDIDGLIAVLEQIEAGTIRLIGRDTREPSPFCYELLNSSPYAFLDGGELQERRARVVSPGSQLSADMPALTWLDPAAIEQVVSEATPFVRDRDELHDLLLSVVILPIPSELALPMDVQHWKGWFQTLVEERRAFQFPLSDGRTAWAATERFASIQALGGLTELPEGYVLPADLAAEVDPIAARIATVRGWMEICGPVTAAELAQHLGWSTSQTAAVLEALEGEGTVMRGRYRASPTIAGEPLASESAASDDYSAVPSPPSSGERVRVRGPSASQGVDLDQVSSTADGEFAPLTPTLSPADGGEGARIDPSVESITTRTEAPADDWCHRRLLARIHRLTLAGLRQQIAPVDVAAFQRFLFHHQGVITDAPRMGANGLFEVIAQLQGLDLPAVCWERDILPARLPDYLPAWLDELCLGGEVGWGRVDPPPNDVERTRSGGLTRVVPVSVFLRGDLPWLLPDRVPTVSEDLQGLAQEVHEHLTRDGALFGTDLLGVTRMLPTHLEDAIGELIARGLVTADSFGGLRSLIAEKKDVLGRNSRSANPAMVRRRVIGALTGRWSLWRRERGPTTSEQRTERLQAWAWQLIRRWGVVFRDLLAVEDCAPRWWELVPIFRRLEARGELRGGRFITGVAGEQFALESTVQDLRRFRDADVTPQVVIVSAADPLNLIGIITDPPQVPAIAGHRIAYRDGIAVAALQAGEVVWMSSKLSAAERVSIEARLLGRPEPLGDVPSDAKPGAPRKPRPRRSTAEYPKQIPRPLIR